MPMFKTCHKTSTAAKSSGQSVVKAASASGSKACGGGCAARHGLDNVRWQKRLQKELMSILKDPPQGVTIDVDSTHSKLTEWLVHMEGAPGSLYEGEKFVLQFKFTPKYPFDSPEVVFTGDNIPIHPHIYSNGHICLSILTEDWSPALSVQAICLSVISMLSSCKEKKRPPDNSYYVKTCSANPKKTKWWYHDDTV